jgi:hypothetical protein
VIGARSPMSCVLCNAGTWSSSAGASSSSSCVSCETGSWSTTGSTQACTNWTVCSAGYSATNTPTSASDRICVDTNACIDNPCSSFSSGCTDIPAPAENTKNDRICGPCFEGYTLVNDSCVNNALIVPACACPAEVGWLVTGCGKNDSRLCPSGFNGLESRACGPHGVWNNPDSSQCVPGQHIDLELNPFSFSRTCLLCFYF